MSEKVTRLEVIDHTTNGVGRILVRYNISVELAYQDDGRTLKVFVKDKESSAELPPEIQAQIDEARQHPERRVRYRRPWVDDDYRDPILDRWPQLGPVTPCGLCGSGLPQRHRVIDAIVDHYMEGEYEDDIADELAMPIAAVEAVIRLAVLHIDAP